MTNKQTIESRRPDECSSDLLDEFERILSNGGEVTANGRRELILQAKCLVFLKAESVLAGVGGLKSPRASYRAGVFEKAASNLDCSHFLLELGWIAVQKEFQGQGMSKRIVGAAMAAISDTRVYATTHHEAMRKVLTQHGFERNGKSYRSADDMDDLELFVWIPPSNTN